MQHKSPNEKTGSPLHDLTPSFGKDVYSPNAWREHGHGMDDKLDKQIMAKLQSLRNKPEAMVDIYRAVPRNTPRDTKINKGDWVTIHKDYARQHGEGVLEEKYRILTHKVPAKHLYTSADSIYEQGYHPKEEAIERSI